MEEKKIYRDIPGGKNRFHSAILTSFSFNFHHFEYQVLKALKQKWITNVGVLVDERMLDSILGVSSGGLGQMTKAYSVDSIKSNGAFHPKINFMVGDEELLAVFGSGNITAGGHGKNHETFNVLYADKKDLSQVGLLQETWEYIKQCSINLEGYSKDRVFNLIPNNCELLKGYKVEKHKFHDLEKTSIALLYDDETSIFQQLSNLLPAEAIKVITIVCPYYDEDGRTLNRLADHFENAKIKVVLPEDFSLPPTEMAKNSRITFYDWSETKRGKAKLSISGKEITKPRKLHAKIFHFKTDNEDYCLIGSANATEAAFGTKEALGKNQEFGALYRSSEINFLKDLGISGEKKVDDVTKLKRSKAVVIEHDKTKQRISKSRILTAELTGTSLKVVLKDEVDKANLQICSDYGDVLMTYDFTKEKGKEVRLTLSKEVVEQTPAYVVILQNGRITTNKCVINRLDKLYNTDPSRENRTIRGLISALEVGKENEFQILSYLNDLNSGKSTSKSGRSLDLTVTADFEELKEKITSEMTYEEAVEASKNEEFREKLTETHNTIRIWETVLRLFKDRKTKQKEELMDEEEDADVSISRERDDSEEREHVRTIDDKKEAERILEKTAKLSRQYCTQVKRMVLDKDTEVNEIHLCQFLVVSHVITSIHFFTRYDLKKGYSQDQWKKILKDKYLTIMQDVLLAFAELLIRKDLTSYEDNEYKQNKLDEYKIKALQHSFLYHYLINNNKPGTPWIMLSDLACFNVMDKLGLPDDAFEEYIQDLSQTNQVTHFNYAGPLRVKSRLESK